MAIINNNLQNVKFLRNGSLFATHKAALTGIQDEFNNVNSTAADGTAILARYGSGSEVKTLVGYIYYASAGSKSLTIFDVEGASDDVQTLREEINEKLGTGFISSTNTVEANLTALSGGTFTPGTSSSANTSVEGAKAYAYDLIGTLDYSGVTTGDGVYVTNVTQTDGIIAATTSTLPSVEDEASAKTFVTSVSEDKGQISVSKGTITSSGKTIVLTDNADGGVNFEANVDGTTIIVDENTGTMSVSSAALVQYEGDGDTIQIGAVSEGVRTVSSPLTISATTPSEANVKEQYNLVGASGNIIGATIKIYKDSALLSVALLHADTTANPQVLPTYDKTNGWTDIDATAQTQANQALCYAYEDVNGVVQVAAVPVGSFINEQEFASGITWDATANKVKGVVDGTSESFLTVGADGFKLSGVQNAIDTAVGNAVSGLDATVSTETTHVSVQIDEVDGKLTAVTLTEDNIANAGDLAELSGKTLTDVESSNSSISAVTTAATDGTVKVDLTTDASKIKMTGFTAAESGFTTITSASTVTEAVKGIETNMISNEQTTAAALNDLDGRLDVIEPIYLSGVSVNGSATTVSDHVAGFNITAANSATTTAGNNAITVQTDANGNITLGLATIDCGTY